jgi:signal transduction histidine kinase
MVAKEELAARIRWFIAMRWLAAAGLALAITAASFGFGLALPLLPLFAGTLFLLAYNLACRIGFARLQARLEAPDWLTRAQRLASAQIFIDLGLLTYLLYFSGGLENPFVFYYIFHMILSAILLRNRFAYLQAAFAVLLLGLVSVAEALGWIPRFPVPGFGSAAMPIPVLVGRLAAFASTLFIAVYFTTSIVNRLRQRERELEEQDRLKSRYVMTVSHDLQAGLAAIEGLLAAVLHGFTEAVGEKTRELLGRASERTHLLLKFVRDLLDLSRMRAETDVQREEVHLAALLQDEAELFADPLAAKKLDFRFENTAGDPVSRGNRTALSQLFNNLIANAVRYTPEGGVVSVGMSRAGEQLQVIVEDTGIGIAPEHLDRLFEDFFRAPNAKSVSEAGTGLGLSIVKQSVQMHGGCIRVDSEVGRGTRFIVTLPVEA